MAVKHMLPDLINQELRFVLQLLMFIDVVEEVFAKHLMSEDLVPRKTLAFIQLQAPLNERFHWIGYLDGSREDERLEYIFDQFRYRPSIPRSFKRFLSIHFYTISIKCLEKYETEGPYISFTCVSFIGQNLRGHVEWGAD